MPDLDAKVARILLKDFWHEVSSIADGYINGFWDVNRFGFDRDDVINSTGYSMFNLGLKFAEALKTNKRAFIVYLSVGLDTSEVMQFFFVVRNKKHLTELTSNLHQLCDRILLTQIVET